MTVLCFSELCRGREEFCDWAFAQPWAPDSGLTGAEHFQLILDKLRELGLPDLWPP